MIYALAHVYLHAPRPHLLYCFVALINISLLREGEIHFMEKLIKRCFRKGYKYQEIFYFLTRVTMCKSVSDHFRDM